MICFKASSFPPTKVTTSGKLCFRWQEEICLKTWFSQNQSILPQNFFFQLSPKRQPDSKCISIINAMKQGRQLLSPVANNQERSIYGCAPTPGSLWKSPSYLPAHLSWQQHIVGMAFGCVLAHRCGKQIPCGFSCSIYVFQIRKANWHDAACNYYYFS